MKKSGNLLRRPSRRGAPAQFVDPNPVLLFNLYAGMLITAAGFFFRLLARDGDSRSTESAEPGVRALRDFYDRGQALQNAHSELIFQAGAENHSIYPIGEQTVWTADLLQYRNIRDDSMVVFLEISREALRVTPFLLQRDVADELAWGLRALQNSIERTWQAGTFRETAFALSGGFEAATVSLHSLTRPDRDDLDDEFMLFA
jgi:hypothetical protein